MPTPQRARGLLLNRSAVPVVVVAATGAGAGAAVAVAFAWSHHGRHCAGLSPHAAM